MTAQFNITIYLYLLKMIQECASLSFPSNIFPQQTLLTH